MSTRRKSRKTAGSGGGEIKEIERRITELERVKSDLEGRISAALAANDRREGRRASKQLERLQIELDGLYDKWTALGD